MCVAPLREITLVKCARNSDTLSACVAVRCGPTEEGVERAAFSGRARVAVPTTMPSSEKLNALSISEGLKYRVPSLSGSLILFCASDAPARPGTLGERLAVLSDRVRELAAVRGACEYRTVEDALDGELSRLEMLGRGADRVVVGFWPHETFEHEFVYATVLESEAPPLQDVQVTRRSGALVFTAPPTSFVCRDMME
jgi:hypothetical protein